MIFNVHDSALIREQYLFEGFLKSGVVQEGQECFLGPNEEGDWKNFQVQSIHCYRTPFQ